MKSVLTLTCLIGLLGLVRVNAEPLIEGRVRLDSGEPVADAQVRLFDMSDLRPGAIARATTDGTGYFALPLAALTGRALPQRFALGQNYPNPFNPSTIIPYQLTAAAAVRLEVFNLLGQRIATLVDGERSAGFHTATWHATDAAGRAVGAGVYIYRMTVATESQTGRMVLIDGQAGVAAGGAAAVLPGASGGGESDGASEQVYGLIVSGEGLAPYVDRAFRVEAGMAPVELVVSAGQYSAGKATDDDCALCDLFEFDAPAAPTNLRFEAVTDSSCTVRWDAAEGAADYDVNYKPAGGGKWTNEPHRGTRLYTTIYDLEPNTEYRWAARAENSDGASEWVFGPNFTTLAYETDETTEEEVADGQVTIPDANLRVAIEAALGKASGVPITVAEMTTLTVLEAGAAGIRNLTGLEFATNLTELWLSANQLTDISALAGLTNLTKLDLSDNNLTDLSALAGLTNLTELWLNTNQITDISALAGLTNLTWLWLSDNNLTNSALAGLTNLTNLTNLGLGHNNLTNISALRGLTNLHWLWLSGNNLKDVSKLASVLSGFDNLGWLVLGSNNLKDISELIPSIHNGLTHLWLDGNDIKDISPLRRLTNLEWLGLAQNNITDISVLSGLTNLGEVGLGYNNISDISALSDLNLTGRLVLEANNISDISALSGQTNLKDLQLGYNNIRDVSALAGLTNLEWLNLLKNPLSASSINNHIPRLQDRGVEVQFNPNPFRGSDFDIEFVFLDPFTDAQKNVFRIVARQWTSVITEDLPDYKFAESWSGYCGDQVEIPAGERIDDLRIYVTSFDVDDNPDAVGWGGPFLLRETYLPVLGCMGFDLKRANLLITGLHEIGHVLGFGTVWDGLGFLQSPNGDTHFNGPRAIAAFNDAGGWNYTGAKVPVDNDLGHWRNSMSGELMVPGGGGALSAITVQSLADLGYGVDVTQADAFTLPDVAAEASAKIAAIPGDQHRAAWGRGRAQGDGPVRRSREALPAGVHPEYSEYLGGESRMRYFGSTSQAGPVPLCGFELRREPIYVIDQQGHIVRTIIP